MHLPTPDAVQITLTLGSLAVALLALRKVIIPAWRWAKRVGARFGGALDNLGGRAEFTDPATGIRVPAIPPIGERLTSIDSRLDALLNVNARLDSHESRLEGHDQAIAALLATKWENGATAMLAATETRNQDAIDAEEDE